MLVIRLLRIGKKHQPSYKIVVTDKRRAPRGGRFVAEVGSWNPLTKQRILKADKIKEWISKGAKPSDTVHNMLVEEKIIEAKKTDVHKKSKKKEEKKPAETPVEQKPTQTPEKKEEPKQVEEKPAEEKKEEKPKEAPVEENKPVEEKKEEPEKVDKSS